MNTRQNLIRRFRLLEKAQASPELCAMLREKCRRDLLFWFDWFAWTFDPRQDQPHQPFVLYPFQREAALALARSLEAGEDLLIEKSRDMGVSWLVLLVFQHDWLFKSGANFHLGSRKQEAVDRKGDISTLFEKLRYNLDWQPGWLKPAGFSAEKHDNLLRLLNPANGNVITGESSNENFGRGGRYRAVLFDEFPFWPSADAAFASAGQSSPSRIIVGTPYGKANRFAELRFSGAVNLLSIHWRLHPLKDDAWYARQCERMSEDEIARELDINYHLSVRDRVFRQFGPRHKASLEPLQGVRILRSWDFGYHCPACLFIQIDAQGRVRVLKELVGRDDLLKDFATRVLAASDELSNNLRHAAAESLLPADLPVVFEDICDPAGAQRSDKSHETSIEILNTLSIYPWYGRSAIKDGIELIRMKLAEIVEDTPCLLVDPSCEKLIEAFEGGYRYTHADSDLPHQEHPYEDVMDCLRYAVMAKCPLITRTPKPARPYRPQNRHTGY